VIEGISGRRPALRLLGQLGTEHQENAAVLEYALPSRADVALDVYDAAGQRVHRLTSGSVGQGVHMASFDTGEFAAGLYACNFSVAGHTCSIPLQIVR
jgi:hypothetical protein